jgi:hypothetical protein
LAELCVTAEEVGLDPDAEFWAVGGAIPSDFHTYAVVRNRRREDKVTAVDQDIVEKARAISAEGSTEDTLRMTKPPRNEGASFESS